MKPAVSRSIKLYLPTVRCGEVHLIINALELLEIAYNGLRRWNLIMSRAEDEEAVQYPGSPSGELDGTVIIPEEDRLCLARLEVTPPAYLEIAGHGQALEVLHTYLADGGIGRARRKKNPDERVASERRRLNSVRLQVELLKALGYSEFEIRTALVKHVITPLNRLARLSGLTLYEERGEDQTRLALAGER
jgi:hypothetical protein